MKTLNYVALAISAVLLCTCPPELLGQNNRRGSSATTTSQQNVTRQSSNSGNKGKSDTHVNERRGSTTNNAGTSKVGSNTSSKPTGSNNPGNKPSGKDDKKPGGKDGNKPGNNTGGNNPGYNPGDNPGHNPGNRPDNRPSGSGINNPPRPGAHNNNDWPYGDKSHRDRDNIGRPRPAYHGGSHYFGHRLDKLPSGYRTIYYNNVAYYYKNGIYYRRHPLRGYVICRPPVGASFAARLFNTVLVRVSFNPYRTIDTRAYEAAALSNYYSRQYGTYIPVSNATYLDNIYTQQSYGYDYYYQDGVFYVYRNGYYYVVEAPLGAVVDNLPEYYREVVIDGYTYYQAENVLYRASLIDGKVWYEVIGVL